MFNTTETTGSEMAIFECCSSRGDGMAEFAIFEQLSFL